jgi:hypothetical protein
VAGDTARRHAERRFSVAAEINGGHVLPVLRLRNHPALLGCRPVTRWSGHSLSARTSPGARRGTWQSTPTRGVRAVQQQTGQLLLCGLRKTLQHHRIDLRQRTVAGIEPTLPFGGDTQCARSPSWCATGVVDPSAPRALGNPAARATDGQNRPHGPLASIRTCTRSNRRTRHRLNAPTRRRALRATRPPDCPYSVCAKQVGITASLGAATQVFAMNRWRRTFASTPSCVPTGGRSSAAWCA